MPDDARGKRAAAFLAVALLAIAPYLPGLPNGIVWDDHFYFDGRPEESLVRPFLEPFHLGRNRFPYYRPLAEISVRLERRAWGEHPAGYHLTNVLMHAAVSTLLLFMLARRLPLLPAFLGAGIFAVHPVHVEAVAFIVGRSDLLASIFILLSLAAFPGIASPPGRRGGAGAIPSGAAFLMALLSKETALVLPAVILLLAPAGEGRRGAARTARMIWPHLAALALYGLLRWAAFAGEGKAGGFMYISSDAAQYPTWLLEVLRLFFFPRKLVPYYLLSPASAARSALALVLAAAIAWGAYRMGRARGWDIAFRLGACLLLLPLVPAMPFTPRQGSLLAERFLYLPSLGLAVLAGAALDLALRGGRRLMAALAAAAAGIWLAAGAAWTSIRVTDWRDDQTLFSRAAARDPRNHVLHYLVGDDLIMRGRLDEAERAMRRSLALYPTFQPARIALAWVQSISGRLEEAHAGYLEALRADPADANLLHMLGTLEIERGDWPAAIDALSRAVALDPGLANAWARLGAAYDGAGRGAEARAAWGKALAADPRNEAALFYLGRK